MSRKSTPDILGELMGETIKQENHKPEKQVPQEAREKVTFMLSKKVLESLDDCWMYIRKIRKDKAITKQILVEAMIEYLLNDLESNKEDSLIYSKLAIW